MKNKGKYIVTLTLVLSLLAGSMNVFAAPAVTGSGTKEDPYTSVDFTGGSDFETWAAGKYFAPDCEFKNLTAAKDKTFTFLPVYDSVKDVVVSAGGGTIGGKASETISVNFTDGTIVNDKELLEQDETKKLGSVLATLPAPVKTGYYPYFYEYDASVANKRLYFGSSVPAGLIPAEGTAAKISDAVYDRNGSLYAVYSDTADATAWKEETVNAAKMIAYRDGYDQAAYAAKFGGLSTLPYGTFSAKKELPGAVSLTYAWTLKLAEETKNTKTTETYTQNQIKKDLDGAVLSEVLHYGPGSCYSLTTAGITYTVYARPVVSAATIN